MRYISTSDTNITFTDTNGKVMVVPKNRVYTHFNVDTVTFLLIERYDNEGICIFTTKAEDLEINGTAYTYEQLIDGEGISDLFSPTGSLSFSIVEELPQSGSNGIIYLVPNGENSYTEYLWIEDEERYEILGDIGDIDLTNYYTKTQVDTALALKQDASTAFSGDYEDLTNKPTIPTVPTNVSAFTNDAGYLTQHQSLDNYYDKTASDAKYATQTVVNEEIAARIQGDAAINSALEGKADKSDTYTKTQVDGFLATAQTMIEAKANSADLATVATSGSYGDLSNKPVIPTVPTNVSDFTNDAGYVTQNDVDTALSDYYTQSDINGMLDNYATQTDMSDVRPYVIDLDTYEKYGFTSENYAEVQEMIGTSKPLMAYYDGKEYSVESIYEDGTIIYITISDNEKHRFFQLTENQATITQTTAEYVSLVEKHVWDVKQPTLVSGTNIKTINNESILGSGNLTIQGGSEVYYINFGQLSVQGMTDADWDGIIAAIAAHRPIYAQLGSYYYAIASVLVNGNVAYIAVSDETSHYVYTITKNGTDNYSLTYETRPYVTSAEKTSWDAKQDALVSGTNIKTINNESILGSGDITISGGGGMDEDTELLISSALVDLNDRKIDASEVKENYQKKGDYATNTTVATKANISDVPTNEDYNEAQKITSWSLNELNARIAELEARVAQLES